MSGSGILLFFLTSSIIFLLMGLALVLFMMRYQRRMMQQVEEIKRKEISHQETLLKATINSQEKERKRIASDLHDSLGAHLSTIRLNVLVYGQEHPTTKEFAESTAEMLSESIQVVREISHDLLPGSLKTYGLMSALRELLNRVESSTAISVSFGFEGEEKRFQNEQELALYRITQELINNTLRHAKASEIEMRVNWLEDGLELKYSDNGVGFISDVQYNGLGMYTIQSRVESFRGNVEFTSKPNHGMSCIFKTPIINE